MFRAVPKVTMAGSRTDAGAVSPTIDQHHGWIVEPNRIAVQARVETHGVALDRPVDHGPQQHATVAHPDTPWRRAARAWPAPDRGSVAARPVRRLPSPSLRQVSSAIRMQPARSSSATAPGGTTQVASYSSTMSGPVRRVARSERRSDRRLDPAALAEVDAARRPRHGLGPARDHALGHARPLAQPLAHDLDRHQLDRLLDAGAMAVGSLVLGAEGLLQDVRPSSHRSGRRAPARRGRSSGPCSAGPPSG